MFSPIANLRRSARAQTGPMTARRHPPRPAAFGWVIMLVVIALPPWLTAARNPLHLDETTFAYMAAVSAETGRPIYHVGHENKPPGIFWLYQAVGARDQATIWRARAVQGCLALATGLILLVWLSPLTGVHTAGLAGLIYVLGAPLLQGPRALTEVPMALCTTLAFSLAWRAARSGVGSRWLAAGIALAAAVAVRPTAMLDLIGLALIIFLWIPRPRGRTALSLLLVGAVVPMLALLAWLFATGQGPEGLQAILGPVRESPQSTVASAARRIVRLLDLWRSVGIALTAPALLALLGAVLPGRVPMLRRWATVWMVFATVAVLMPGTLYDHQVVQLLPPLCLLAALGVWRLGADLRGSPLRRAALLSLPVLLLLTGLLDGYQRNLHTNLRHLARPPVTAEVEWGEWLDSILPLHETIFVAGNATAVYLHSGRHAPTRWVYSWLLGENRREQVIWELTAKRPAAILLSGGYMPEQHALTEALRQMVATLGYHRVAPPLPDGWELYLRPDILPAARAAGGQIDPPGSLPPPEQLPRPSELWR